MLKQNCHEGARNILDGNTILYDASTGGHLKIRRTRSAHGVTQNRVPITGNRRGGMAASGAHADCGNVQNSDRT